MILIFMFLLFLIRGEGQTVFAPGQGRPAVHHTGNTILLPCTLYRPCRVRFNNRTYTLTQEGKITSMVGSGTVYLTVEENGTVVAWYDFTSVVCINVACAKAAIQNNGILLAQCFVTGGVVQGCVDMVPMVSRDTLGIGWGLTMVGTTVSVQSGLFPTIGLVPSSSTSPCTAGTMATDEQWLYLCVVDNVWRRAALSTW